LKTDGLFTVHSFTIPIKHKQTIKIIPFGDVHRDSPNHAHTAWKEDLKYFRTQKNAWFLGMGDYLDSTSTSERDCLGRISADLHETLSSDLNALQVEKVKLLERELGFMRGRLIGLMGGNHYWKFAHGGTSDTELARLLGAQYLGVSSFIRLTLNHSGRCFSLDIWGHHGAGGARLPGGDINRVDQMREHAEADIYIMGHTHKRAVVPATPRLYLSASPKGGLRVKHRQQWLIRSGSYLASYEHNVRNYNVDAARGPCSLGHVELMVTLIDGYSKTESEIKIQGIS
jgi:hypothetical protein